MNPRLIVILAALSMLGALSIDAYLPALPAIADQFSVSATAVQQSLTVYVFAFAVMTLFYGTLSDSFGRRPVILVSLVLYLLSSLGAAWAQSLPLLILFRLLQGLSAGAGAVVGRAVVGDLASGPEANKALSYISVVFGLAPAIAPIVGGWLQATAGWRSIFIFIAAFTVLLLAACVLWLPESLAREKRQPFHFRVILNSYLEVGSHAQFMLRGVGIALCFGGIMVYVAGAPNFVLDILHLHVTEFAWMFLPLIGGMTLGSLVSAKLSHRYLPEQLIRTGFALMIVAAGANVVYTSLCTATVPWAVIPLGFYSFGVCLAVPAMTVIALEMFPHVRGMASSLQTFLFMMLFTVESGLVVPLLFGDPFKFAAAGAVAAFLGILCWGLSGKAKA